MPDREELQHDNEVLAYINRTPTLLSLLYDLDLLPEQHPDRGSEAWEKIFTITNHWRELVQELLSPARGDGATQLTDPAALYGFNTDGTPKTSEVWRMMR